MKHKTRIGLFSIGARKFVEGWNVHGPAHHCAVGVGGVADKITKLGQLLGIETVRVCRRAPAAIPPPELAILSQGAFGYDARNPMSFHSLKEPCKNAAAVVAASPPLLPA